MDRIRLGCGVYARTKISPDQTRRLMDIMSVFYV